MQFLLSRPIYLTILMVLLAFLLYGKSLNNHYSLDDHLVVNPMSEMGWKGIPKAFKSGYMKNEQQGTISDYRPVTVASFAIEIAIFGKNAKISHAINILLYGLTGALLFLFLSTLFSSPILKERLFTTNLPISDKQPTTLGLSTASLLALLSTIFFMCHALHSEVIINIKSRDEILAFLLTIGAVHLLVQTEKISVKRIAAVFLCSLFAISSKNTIFPVLLLLLLGATHLQGLMKPKQIVYGMLLVSISFLLVGLVYKLYIEINTAKRIFEYIENPLCNLSVIERIPTGLSVMLIYLKLLLFPQPLLYYYGYNYIPMNTWADPIVWVSLCFHVALVIFAIRQYRQRPILAYAIVYYIANAFIYSNILKIGPGIVAERFFYSGSLGFCIVLSYFVVYVIKQPRVQQNINMRLLIIGIVLVCCIFQTVWIHQRIPAWKDLLTLLKTDMPRLNNSAKANLLYADVLVKDLNKATLEQWQLAEKHYRRAIEIYPNYSTPYNNLGFFYLKTSRFAEANEILLKAKGISPNSSQILYNLGSASLRLGMEEKARGYFEEAVAYQPQTEAGLATFGALHNFYGKKGDTTAMTRNLVRGMIFQPEIPFFYDELFRHYTEQQKLVYLRNRLQSAADTLPVSMQKNIRKKIKELGGQ